MTLADHYEQIFADCYQRIWRAMMLAPTLEVCCALLRDEKVPLSELDSEWVRRLGLK